MSRLVPIAVMAMAMTISVAGAQTSTPQNIPAAPGTSSPGDARGTRLSMIQAVEAAEQREGGRALSAEYDDDGGGEWEVKVVRADGRLVEITMDAATGQVKSSDNQPLERLFTRLKPADLQNVRTTLRDAIALAEQQGGGRAVEAEIERDNDAIHYEITVQNGDRSEDYRVSADGRVAKD